MAQPGRVGGRVAVIGGGVAGTMCAWLLRSKGSVPTVYDLGATCVGGRFGTGSLDYGAQFIRSSEDVHYNTILSTLQQQKLIAPWKGRFGVLGAKGGFLSKDIINSSSASTKQEDEGYKVDNGDFCGFISSKDLYMGLPNMGMMCQRIIKDAEITVKNNTKVESLVYHPSTSSWTVNNLCDQYDAVVIAVHDPSFAAKVVLSNCTSQNLLKAGPDQVSDQGPAANSPDLNSETSDLEQITKKFATELQDLRDSHKAPVFTLTCTFPSELSSVPFDAVTIPNSPHIQFITRENSKPGRTEGGKVGEEGKEEVLIAVSTTAFAEELLKVDGATATKLMQRELLGLLDQFDVDVPVSARAKRWGAGFCSSSLGLKEDCVSFEQWKIAVCGDYISNRSTPIEAAVLSGIEAGGRVSSWFAAHEHKL